MKRLFRELNSFAKGFILFLRPGIWIGFLSTPFLFISNLLSLTKWIGKQKNKNTFNDFYKPVRQYSDREKLYDYILQTQSITDKEIDYLEFGVYQANSFKWWLKANKNQNSRFYGFDTFEGLPEQWGTYSKGDMNANLPSIDDTRHEFVKGLFQETLNSFLQSHVIGRRPLMIHMDADLFSSTLFVLSTLGKYLKKGDIILFDEFNVPNHEYFAFKVFTESFYIKYKLLGAVNNYYQCAFEIL
jgi:O-methyltransferase